MGKKHCCCGCSTYADTFDRSNSTDIGDDWDESSGDWSILDHELREAGSNGATAVFGGQDNGTSLISGGSTTGHH